MPSHSALLAKSQVVAGDASFTPTPEAQQDRSTWPSLREHFTTVFKQKTRDEWATWFIESDACIAPVLEPNEVGPDGEGVLETTGPQPWSEFGGIPEPAPLLHRTPARRAEDWYKSRPPGEAQYFLPPGSHTKEVLDNLGYTEAEVEAMLVAKAVQSC